MTQGELKEFTKNFIAIRRLAIDRLAKQAQQQGANAVLGIKIAIYPFGKAAEMLTFGAACQTSFSSTDVITSNLSAAEVWSLAQLGYAPKQLLIGSAVYTLGLSSNLLGLKSFFRGESQKLSTLLQEGREKAMLSLNQQAQALNADKVLGVKIYTQPLGDGAIEFIALGTAIQKLTGVKTASKKLPVQACILHEKTFYNELSNFDQGTTRVLTRLLLILLIAGSLLWLWLGSFKI